MPWLSRMKSPYLDAVNPPRKMSGKGAPRDTVFGVLGRTKMDPYTRSLGGLVKDTATGKVQPGTLKKDCKVETERGICGNVSKTHIPGAHFAQIPYPGTFMAHEGKRLS